VGSTVTQFVVGDRVFGARNGAHAEYLYVREAGEGMSFTEAAAVTDCGSADISRARRRVIDVAGD
jgi:NADPH:quinone reductase-like Zn-dependent oxidoreductase